MTPEQFGLSWKEVVFYAFMLGFVWREFKALTASFESLRQDIADIKKDFKEDLQRLETKVEKHNTFDRRIIRLETILGVKGNEDAKI